LEVPRNRLVVFVIKSAFKIKMCMEHWWNYIERGKVEVLGAKSVPLPFFEYTSQMNPGLRASIEKTTR
jgi:hypothetical protein